MIDEEETRMWHDYRMLVQMPHMAPGEKLSEVEFLKMLAAYQWESISRALGMRPPEIVSEQDERLYGSVIDVALHLAPHHTPETLGEDVEIHVRNQVRFFAKKFVEGLFVIDHQPIPDSLVTSIKRREDLESSGLSYACMTNAFIARGAGNTRLRVFRPKGAEAVAVPELTGTPLGIVRQGRSQETGELEPLAEDAPWIELVSTASGPIRYAIVPESDLNGAGLVYFARYEAMMNYAERILLCERLDPPFSSELVTCLSTEHRKAFFYANAGPSEEVQLRLRARLLPRSAFAAPPLARYRAPFKLELRIDLHRSSDGMLMASSLVRKSANVPGNAKAVLAEAERLLRRLDAAGPAA